MKITFFTETDGNLPGFNWNIFITSRSFKKLYSAINPIGPVNCSSQIIAYNYLKILINLVQLTLFKT